MVSAKLLFIDTTKPELVVAVISGGEVVARADGGQEIKRHSEIINAVAAPYIADADAFAVITGMDGGSWTGSRVGVVAVKAWAYATAKPIVSIYDDGTHADLIGAAWQMLQKKQFTDAKTLAPRYDAEFKITPPRV